jgi:uncharacterized protein YkwD
MYRVVLAILAGSLLAGCSMGTASLPLNLNNEPATPIDSNFVSGGSSLGDHAGSSRGTSVAPAAQRAPSKQPRTAMLDDRAPKGEITKAPAGALADRDYRQTALNVAKARKLINDYRRRNGLKPLTIDAKLTEAAEAHSRDLAKWDRISHYGSDGSNPWDRVRRTGYKASLAAENVGTGQVTLEEVFKGWRKSPGHNKNLLLKDAQHMGIALVYDAKTEFKTFWTLVLGAKG